MGFTILHKVFPALSFPILFEAQMQPLDLESLLPWIGYWLALGELAMKLGNGDKHGCPYAFACCACVFARLLA